MADPVELTVVGSINIDFVARMERLPQPGETVAAHQFSRLPGGKGANQAVAAARLGARVKLIGAVGDDALAEEALAGLVAAGVELELERQGQTGVALIYVDAAGENEIAVFPGANASVTPRELEGAVLCQLEVPDEVVLRRGRPRVLLRAQRRARRAPIDLVPDLLVVNRFEHEVVSRGKLVAVTYGKDGAVLYEDGAPGRRLRLGRDHPARRHRGRRRVHRLPARLAARGAAPRGGAPPRLHGRGLRRGDGRRPELAADERATSRPG